MASLMPMNDAAIRRALRRTDTTDTRRLSGPWYEILPRVHGSKILPLVTEAFGATKASRGRACQVHYSTLFARVDHSAIELGLRALADPTKEVRSRACMLLAHSRAREVVLSLRAVKAGPTLEVARRAVRSILEGKPFGPDDDPLYFFFRGDRGRAPRGSFADNVERETGEWFEKQGFRPKYLFAHAIGFCRDDLTVSAQWDGYEVETRVGRSDQPLADEIVRYGSDDIAEIARRMRMMSSP
jgi:hypothetical protein